MIVRGQDFKYVSINKGTVWLIISELYANNNIKKQISYREKFNEGQGSDKTNGNKPRRE